VTPCIVVPMFRKYQQPPSLGEKNQAVLHYIFFSKYWFMNTPIYQSPYCS